MFKLPTSGKQDFYFPV
jgi:hypothetical protein